MASESEEGKELETQNTDDFVMVEHSDAVPDGDIELDDVENLDEVNNSERHEGDGDDDGDDEVETLDTEKLEIEKPDPSVDLSNSSGEQQEDSEQTLQEPSEEADMESVSQPLPTQTPANTNDNEKKLKEEINTLNKELNKLKEEEKRRKKKEKNKPDSESTEKDPLLALWEDLANAAKKLRAKIWEIEKALPGAGYKLGSSLGSSVVKLGVWIKDQVNEKQQNPEEQEQLKGVESRLTDQKIEQIPRQSLEDFLAEVERENLEELDDSEWHKVEPKDYEVATLGTESLNQYVELDDEELDDIISEGDSKDIELEDINLESNTNSDLNLEKQQDNPEQIRQESSEEERVENVSQTSQTNPCRLEPQPDGHGTQTEEQVKEGTRNLVLPKNTEETPQNTGVGSGVELTDPRDGIRPGSQ